MTTPGTSTDRPLSDNTVPTTDPLDQGPGASRNKIVAVITAIAVVSGIWIYIIFFYRPELLIDELADKTFPTQAEQICAAARARLDELPFASQAATPKDRAEEVARSNEILDQMLLDLQAITPESPPVANEAVTEWLADWTTYLGDREEYVSNLLEDPDARFLETAKGGPNKGITKAITSFAQVNRMDSCATPADLS